MIKTFYYFLRVVIKNIKTLFTLYNTLKRFMILYLQHEHFFAVLFNTYCDVDFVFVGDKIKTNIYAHRAEFYPTVQMIKKYNYPIVAIQTSLPKFMKKNNVYHIDFFEKNIDKSVSMLERTIETMGGGGISG
jgi:hypothetical protein